MADVIRPFLKWPGSKYRLLPRIKSLLSDAPVWVEPFAGSAAVFLNTECEQALVNDINPDLIHLFCHLQTEPDELIAQIRQLFQPKNNDSDHYYTLRDQFNASTCTLERSSLFVYLNRHGFNGLCRYNQSGYFNVPFGRYHRPYFPEEELQAFVKKAKQARFSAQDFTCFLENLPAKAAIYCDPPYVPLSETANFTDYAGGGFSWQQHEQLVQRAWQLAKAGHSVLISNHDTASTRRLYQDAEVVYFTVARSISAKVERRKKAPELLALFQS